MCPIRAKMLYQLHHQRMKSIDWFPSRMPIMTIFEQTKKPVTQSSSLHFSLALFGAAFPWCKWCNHTPVWVDVRCSRLKRISYSLSSKSSTWRKIIFHDLRFLRFVSHIRMYQSLMCPESLRSRTWKRHAHKVASRKRSRGILEMSRKFDGEYFLNATSIRSRYKESQKKKISYGCLKRLNSIDTKALSIVQLHILWPSKESPVRFQQRSSMTRWFIAPSDLNYFFFYILTSCHSASSRSASCRVIFPCKTLSSRSMSYFNWSL